MCGRFTQVRPWSELVGLYEVTAKLTPLNLPSRHNIAPTQDVVVVRRAAGSKDRELALLRWGLVPFWAKDIGVGSKMINARAETIEDKPAFRGAFRQRRCLVVADGFYEWKKTTGPRKQPYFITVAGGRPFAFAGLWEIWKSLEGERVESCIIIVAEANQLLRSVHDRMPVILDPEVFGVWLDTDLPLNKAKALLKPYDGDMTIYPVSHRVSNVRNDDPACVEPTGPAATGRGSAAIPAPMP